MPGIETGILVFFDKTGMPQVFKSTVNHVQSRTKTVRFRTPPHKSCHKYFNTNLLRYIIVLA